MCGKEAGDPRTFLGSPRFCRVYLHFRIKSISVNEREVSRLGSFGLAKNVLVGIEQREGQRRKLIIATERCFIIAAERCLALVVSAFPRMSTAVGGGPPSPTCCRHRTFMFECAKHRPTPRPSVQWIRSRRRTPTGFLRRN